MTRMIYPLCMAVSLLVPITVSAHEGATGVVKERMEKMKTMSSSMKALAQYVKGGKPLDPSDIAKHADVLHTHSGEDLVGLFPEDSLSETSEARPEIWQKWEKFETLAHDLKSEAQTLSRIAENAESVDGEALRKTFVNVAGTCKVCHTDFRLKKD